MEALGSGEGVGVEAAPGLSSSKTLKIPPLEALEKVKKSDFSPYQTDVQPSYFSFPTKDHWQEFRKRGGMFR